MERFWKHNGTDHLEAALALQVALALEASLALQVVLALGVAKAVGRSWGALGALLRRS